MLFRSDTLGALPLARLYVAMTRPQFSLWLGVSEQAWQQMAQSTAERTTS